MGKTNLGRVALVSCGAYDNTREYKRLDVVEHNGSSYVFLQDSIGVEPTGDNIVTMLLAKKGKDFAYSDFTPEQLAALKGEKGDKGEVGKGFTILGYYGTLDLLKAGVTSPEPGDAYGIGEAAPYEIHVFDGVTNDWVNNGALSGGIGEEVLLGEFRYSTKINNPFGEKYVICAGQPVSTEDYPNAVKVLPVKGLATAVSSPYPLLTELPYIEMNNTSFQITDELIGKTRIVAIPPATENPTDEDYMAMYASMKMYVDISRDGENWTQVYEFPNKEGEVFGSANPLMVNGKLIFPLQIVKFDLENQTQTTEVGRLLITSDFDNFQTWEELEMNIPGASTTEWEIKSMAYGQGTYIAILKETHEGINRMTLLKSPDLVNWEYAYIEATSWDQTGTEWYNLSVHYVANRWLIQYGYFFVGDNIDTLFSNENVSSGDGVENDLQDDIEDVYYQFIEGIDVYILHVSNGVYQLTFDTTTNCWKSIKQSSPTGFGTSERCIALSQMGEGTFSWLVLGNSNHYYVWPNGKEVGTLSLGEGASGWVLDKVLRIGVKLFLIPDRTSDSPYLSSTVAATPAISSPEMGLNAYIKLK